MLLLVMMLIMNFSRHASGLLQAISSNVLPSSLVLYVCVCKSWPSKLLTLLSAPLIFYLSTFTLFAVVVPWDDIGTFIKPSHSLKFFRSAYSECIWSLFVFLCRIIYFLWLIHFWLIVCLFFILFFSIFCFHFTLCYFHSPFIFF